MEQNFTMQNGTPAAQKVSTLVSRINTITSGISDDGIQNDPRAREELYQVSKALVASLEQPYRTVGDLAFSGSRLVAVSLACDIGLFQHLSAAKGPLTLSELASLCNAEEALVMHITRTLSTQNYIAEVEVPGLDPKIKAFTANELTEHMIKPNVQAGIKCHFELNTPVLCRATDYFRQNQYRMPPDMSHGLFNWFHSTNEPSFTYWAKQPEASQIMNNFIRGYFGAPHSTPVQWFPYEKTFFNDIDNSKSEYVWVDVGGGKGLHISKLLDKYPQAAQEGRFALEDLPNTISQITSDGLDSRIERVPHDFFTPQPIRGSRVYCIENVLHNWDDESAQKILGRIRDAMIPGYSKLMVSCMIYPDKGASAFLAELDAYLLWIHNSGTRSEKAWRELVEGVDGLRVVNVSFDPITVDGNGVIEVERVD